MSQPPNVPNIYRWRDPASGEILLNLNHRNGYGGWSSLDVGDGVDSDLGNGHYSRVRRSDACRVQ